MVSTPGHFLRSQVVDLGELGDQGVRAQCVPCGIPYAWRTVFGCTVMSTEECDGLSLSPEHHHGEPSQPRGEQDQGDAVAAHSCTTGQRYPRG